MPRDSSIRSPQPTARSGSAPRRPASRCWRPSSMATAGTIATGGEANLVHRAAGVALKEGRKLVLVPRETPLSTIHLENLLKLRQAGAVILFAAPGFYRGAETIDDLVDFIAGRCLAQLGLEQSLVKPWGEE